MSWHPLRVLMQHHEISIRCCRLPAAKQQQRLPRALVSRHETGSVVRPAYTCETRCESGELSMHASPTKSKKVNILCVWQLYVLSALASRSLAYIQVQDILLYSILEYICIYIYTYLSIIYRSISRVIMSHANRTRRLHVSLRHVPRVRASYMTEPHNLLES